MHFNSFEEYLAFINSKHDASAEEARELKEAPKKRGGKKKNGESVQTD